MVISVRPYETNYIKHYKTTTIQTYVQTALGPEGAADKA